MKIKKGDNVIVISGKDKGKTGKVTLAIPSADKVVVGGLNIRKIHKKPRNTGQKGQIVDQASPMHVSNIMLVDPKTNKPTRIGIKIINGKKKRITQKSQTEI